MPKSSTDRSRERRARLKAASANEPVDILGAEEPGGVLRAAIALLGRLDAEELRIAIAVANTLQQTLHATERNDRCNDDATGHATGHATKDATVVQRSPAVALARAVKTSDLSGKSSSSDSNLQSSDARETVASNHATEGATEGATGHATTDATEGNEAADSDDDDELPSDLEGTAKRLLRQGYAQRYKAATGDAWMAWSANDRDITDVARWVARLSGDMQANVDALLNSFFADAKVIDERWPWRWLAKTPGKYRNTKIRSTPKPAGADKLAELDAAVDRARAAGDLDAEDRAKAERDAYVRSVQSRRAS